MITEKQREQRRKYIGSSDASAVVGVNPFKNAQDVYYDKIRPLSANEKDFSRNDAIEVGNFLEKSILEWFSATTDKKIIKNQRRVSENKVMAANFDAIVDGGKEAVEAKTSGVTRGFFDRDQWGEPETDEVPDYIITQCMHQMAVMPSVEIVWVPVLLGGLGLRKYRIERNDSFIKELTDQELDFWHNHVAKQIPPADGECPGFNTLRKIYRVEGKKVSLDNNLISDYIVAKTMAKAAKQKEDELKKQILTDLGDAEIGESDLGSVTYKSITTKDRMVRGSTYRTMRFKKSK